MYFLEREGEPPHSDFLAPMRTMSAAQGRVIFNPGSVGQPRDGDCRACCGIYDSAAATFEIFRVHYDVGATQARIRSAGLPEMLAERLSLGY
jgi:diadenosine tetraphosphatase ApaH/serine/threonine PP2A family protein phosphatase